MNRGSAPAPPGGTLPRFHRCCAYMRLRAVLHGFRSPTSVLTGRMQANSILTRWHAFVTSRELAGLDDLLADNVVFHSPVVHSPQRGKPLTTRYLTGAYHVLADAGFRYVREVVGPKDAILEFTAELEGVQINGVDMMRWNDEGKIDDFKVMIRPLKAINLLHALMGRMLEQLKGNGA